MKFISHQPPLGFLTTQDKKKKPKKLTRRLVWFDLVEMQVKGDVAFVHQPGENPPVPLLLLWQVTSERTTVPLFVLISQIPLTALFIDESSGHAELCLPTVPPGFRSVLSCVCVCVY